LYNQYPPRWIGGGGPHHWPARSPDLNHLSAAHNSEADLRVRIQEAFVSVTEEIITNATTRSLLRICHSRCFGIRGGHGKSAFKLAVKLPVELGYVFLRLRL
jgi:hypothetical protein